MDGLNQANLRFDEICEGMTLAQFSDGFSYGTDAVLLAAFADVRAGSRGCELGTGTGIVPILMFRHKKCSHITALEIQPEYAALAAQNAANCGFSDRIKVIEGDLKDDSLLKQIGELDFVVSNPPYMKTSTGYLNENPKKLIARHEIHCDIRDVCRGASKLLRHGGEFFVIYRPDRLPDLICALRENSLEPKLIVPVSAGEGKPPVLILCRAKKHGGAEMKLAAPFIIESPDGQPSRAMRQVYDSGRMEISVRK